RPARLPPRRQGRASCTCDRRSRSRGRVVPAFATTFEAAPLDRTARITTRTMWLAAAASFIAGAAVAAIGSGWSGLLLVVLGLVLVALLVWTRRIEPL